MLIRYFADICELTGESELRWDKPEANLGELLTDLSERYGSRFQHRIFRDRNGKELSEAVIVLINGLDVRHRGAAKAPLRQDDTVAIFPAVAGGYCQAGGTQDD